ncbi:MAG TPA: TetR/AcrR family transcriptional regulator [Candidatus Caccalectryoclostridium excrementigallinarum]|uniref:TetR/AcrR family transcriptional regulator n=1 Tax=Candidatus Caccalectryoclostridium excrementigallinarum TaxID=2840710 RepID=A0A9D1SJQ1_9FIRM|nr:TetR/AcrR family transcriptional regulator [Candidatus Caccalectryoclostridium excrementigallinarum]
MPKGSKELTKARKDEIVNACAELYDKMPYKEITPGKISELTSFTRTSIYNYFKTREEIFLALLQREYEEWTRALTALAESKSALDADGFAREIAHSLSCRGRMFKLLSVNIYEIEAESREENLVLFKRAYGAAIEALRACLRRFFPALEKTDEEVFIYAFLPFLFGVYPYAHATQKQISAMQKAGVEVPSLSEFSLVSDFLKALLDGLLKK